MTPVQRKVEATIAAAERRFQAASQKLKAVMAENAKLTPEERNERRREVEARKAGTPRLNIYVCPECGGHTVTVDVDEGVTPFMIGCRVTQGCQGDARSSFYSLPPGDPPVPTFEFYKPTLRKAKRLDRRYPGTLEHVQRGGLLIRPRTDAAPVLHKKPD